MKYKGIIIFGVMGSGKDTLAAMLEEKIFGSRIYKLGEDIRGFVDKVMDGENNRSQYQDYGQMVRTTLIPDAWNRLCEYKIKRDIDHDRVSIPLIADGRQVNEYEYWREKGFLTIGLNTRQNKRIDRLIKRDGTCDIERMTHDTELQAQYVVTQLVDMEICNDLEIDQLKKYADMIANVIREDK